MGLKDDPDHGSPPLRHAPPRSRFGSRGSLRSRGDVDVPAPPGSRRRYPAGVFLPVPALTFKSSSGLCQLWPQRPPLHGCRHEAPFGAARRSLSGHLSQGRLSYELRRVRNKGLTRGFPRPTAIKAPSSVSEQPSSTPDSTATSSSPACPLPPRLGCTRCPPRSTGSSKLRQGDLLQGT